MRLKVPIALLAVAVLVYGLCSCNAIDPPSQPAYELAIHLTVDGQQELIDRIGRCHYGPSSTGGAVQALETGKYSSSLEVPSWDDGFPGAVGLILQNHAAVVVELPNLCPGMNFSGKTNWEIKHTSPLLTDLPSWYRPAVIWIKDVRQVDSFELYPSIARSSDAPMHVRITDIRVRALKQKQRVSSGTPQETALAQQFGWRQRNDTPSNTYVAQAAIVVPESAFDMDPFLREFFASQKHIIILPSASAQGTVPTYKAALDHIAHDRKLGFCGGAFGASSFLSNSAVDLKLWNYATCLSYYEIPMRRKGDDWVLDPQSQGVRYYSAWRTLVMDDARDAANPGHPYLRNSPFCGVCQMPLSYGGVTLYPAMNAREKRLYLMTHPGLSEITDGMIFDPQAKVVIWLAHLQFDR